MALRLEPMTDEQYLRYREHSEEDHACNIAASGAMLPPEAREKARQDFQGLLPDGLATEGHRLWTGGPPAVGEVAAGRRGVGGRAGGQEM
ncbi:hypothetical protein [Micromonospora sp. HUAS LYJ1]|uniref:hypothetical protein n=1 Tax=Micromonospora sp. HUAS LYJ1 TaxID=3061626 RepID=UPI002673B3B7|nr:hypothetical protein [Micromonospora sp. HUAS LYJ1]WKU08336.1 hypothetical protein Q2K16_15555 [Micromonospora sp. HUAS LYJ1]